MISGLTPEHPGALGSRQRRLPLGLPQRWMPSAPCSPMVIRALIPRPYSAPGAPTTANSGRPSGIATVVLADTDRQLSTNGAWGTRKAGLRERDEPTGAPLSHKLTHGSDLDVPLTVLGVEPLKWLDLLRAPPDGPLPDRLLQSQKLVMAGRRWSGASGQTR